MAYRVYEEDVEQARKYSVPNTSVEENSARMGARRMGWALAHAWRESNGFKASDKLPVWMISVLEEEGPD